MTLPESSFPDPASILPHGEPMVFLDRILEHTSERTRCRIPPGSVPPGPAEGPVTPWVGLEYLGQTACVRMALDVRPGPLRLGLLIGARDVEVRVDALPRAEILVAEAETLLLQETLGSMHCRLLVASEDRVIMRGRLNAYIPGEHEEFMREVSP